MDLRGSLAGGTRAPNVVRVRRAEAVAATLAVALLLSGCQLPTFYGFRGATKQGHDEFLLYGGTFIAAIVVGTLTGLLILWSIVRYRRGHSQDMPRQFQYHIPLELMYTILPIVIVLVLFFFTVVTENRVDALASKPAVTVNTYAFQWGWEFDYQGKGVSVVGETVNDPDPVGLNGTNSCAPADDCLGPGLVVPAGRTVQINLRSKDTIHGFYVPAFNFSRYAQPGVLNQFDLTVDHPGIYRAQCTQFCGLYHSIMYFHVVALPPSQFAQWLNLERATAANTGAAVASQAAS